MSGYDRYEEYDFDKIVDRRHSGSMKWDVAENELPMWVADMDFQTAPQVRQAIARRAAHGVFGYTIVPDEWYRAYVDWWKNRHSFEMQKDWLIFCTGVVPAISSMVRKLTTDYSGCCRHSVSLAVPYRFPGFP